MKISEIKKLVERYEIHQLMQAEADLIDEKKLEIEVEGDDEGEMLTHILASVWIKEEMAAKGLEFTIALRAYTARVRSSIS